MSGAQSGSLSAEKPMTMKSWIATFGAILGAFMAILDIQITNASLADITGGLGATTEDGSWISTAYLVAEIIVIPLSGWLASVLSLRTYLIWTTSFFLCFSVACGMAWNIESMIVFRAFQGFTGGALIPLAFQVILSLPASKRTFGLALFSITATFAPAIGPTVGGYLTDSFHWSVIFYMNLLPGVFMLAAVVIGIEAQKRNFAALKTADYPGILCMAVGLASLTVFLEEGQRKDWFGSELIVKLCVASVVFLSAFIFIEFKTKNPFINLRLLKQRNFGFGCMVNFVVGLAMYGALYLLPYYLTSIQRYNAVYIGETMMWAGLPQLAVIPFVPFLLKRFDPRLIAFVGINIFGFSCLMNTNLTPDFGIDQLKWSQIVRAIGQPLLMVPLSTITMGLIAPKDGGSASGLFNMLRNLGGSVGIAILATILTIREHFHSAKLGEGVTIYSAATQQRLAAYKAKLMTDGFDAYTASQKALAMLDQVVRKQAYLKAFNDCFMFVAVALCLSSVLILLCKKVASGSGGEGAH